MTQPPPRRRGSNWWKWLLAAAGVLLILILGVVLAFDTIVRVAVRKRIEQVTGMKTGLIRFDVRFREPGVHIKGFYLANTEEFGGGTFLDIPELTVTIDRHALSERKLHLKLARVNIAEINVAVSKEGKTNYVELQQRLEQQRAGQEKTAKKDPPEFAGLDRFEFNFGTLRYTDLRDPDACRAARIGLKDLVIENMKTKEEFGGKFLVALLSKGVPLLDLLGGGIENLPQKDEK